MTQLAWTMLIGGGLLAGAALVGLLAMRRPLEPFMILAGMLTMGVCGAGVARVSAAYDSLAMTLAAIAIAVGCVAGGYGIASSILTGMAARPRKVTLAEEVSFSDSQGIAVIVYAPVESERYSPGQIAGELVDLASAGLPEATIGVTPFLYTAQKARYRAVGGTSSSMRQARAVVDQLMEKLDPERYGRVDLVTGCGKDNLDAAVLRLQKMGYSQVVVAPVAVAESYSFDEQKDRVGGMRPDLHGMRVAYGAPLWGSDLLAGMMADRVASFLVDSQTTGVVLVLHGQPESRERSHPIFDVQENSFANRVRTLLIEHGLLESNVRLAWAEWRTPDITESVRHLAALGCQRILVSPVTYPFESIATVLDLAVAVRQSRVGAHIYATTLQPWGVDELLVQALEESVLRATEDL